jgi:hypothetical protein
MGLFDRFRAARATDTAQALQTAVDAYTADLAGLELQRDQLIARRRAAIEAADEAALETAKRDIRDAEERIGDLKDVIAATERRLAEATAAEHRADVGRQLARAPIARDEMVRLLKEAHVLCRDLLSMRDQFFALRSEVTNLNALASSEGLADLMVEVPPNGYRGEVVDAMAQQSLGKSAERLAREINAAKEALEQLEIRHQRDILAIRDFTGEPREQAELLASRDHLAEEIAAQRRRVAALQQMKPRAADNLTGPGANVALPIPFDWDLKISGYTVLGSPGERPQHWIDLVFPELAHAPPRSRGKARSPAV